MAWLGCYESMARLGSIAAVLRLRSTSRVSELIAECDRNMIQRQKVRADFLDVSGRVVASSIFEPTSDPGFGISKELLPGYAANFDLGATFPILNSLPQYAIRVTPLSEGAEYWAMVSLTDNETQHVLIITAQ